MDENKFNTCFKNSLNNLETHDAFKIPDAGHGFSISKPYDGYSHYKNGFLAWEGKRIVGLSAFNFNKFEPQQIPSLLRVRKNEHKAIVVLYFYIPRSSFCIILDIFLIEHLINSKKYSILSKDIVKLENYNIPLQKELFDLSNLDNKIITIEAWDKLICKH